MFTNMLLFEMLTYWTHRMQHLRLLYNFYHKVRPASLTHPVHCR